MVVYKSVFFAVYLFVYIVKARYFYDDLNNLFTDCTSTFVLFGNERAILDAFEKERRNEPIKVDVLLNAYKECFFNPSLPKVSKKKKPFVVLVGNNRTNKVQVAKMLAFALNAKYFSIPPKCLIHLEGLFNKNTLLRQAYYQLGVFASSYKIKLTLEVEKAVVMNGYWYGQSYFNIAKFFKNPIQIPGPEDRVFQLPEGLIPPDMVIFLDYPFDWIIHSTTRAYTTRPDWIPKTLKIYSKFRNPQVNVLRSSDNIGEVTLQIQKLMKENLHGYDLNI